MKYNKLTEKVELKCAICMVIGFLVVLSVIVLIPTIVVNADEIDRTSEKVIREVVLRGGR
jgi:hypothetical protein